MGNHIMCIQISRAFEPFQNDLQLGRLHKTTFNQIFLNKLGFEPTTFLSQPTMFFNSTAIRRLGLFIFRRLLPPCRSCRIISNIKFVIQRYFFLDMIFLIIQAQWDPHQSVRVTQQRSHLLTRRGKHFLIKTQKMCVRMVFGVRVCESGCV